MGLNIKNAEVENLAAELAVMTHVSKTEAIRVALTERRERLKLEQAARVEQTLSWLKTEVWPKSSPTPLAKGEEDQVLGFGGDGV